MSSRLSHKPLMALGMLALAAGPLVIAVAGPDVVLSEIYEMQKYDAVGDIRAYAIGSRTCNIGTANLDWVWEGTPGLAMNAYRLHAGRIQQIGMSAVKHACCAENVVNAACGTCASPGGHSFLGPGCMDVYWASYNGLHSGLGPRSNINAYTGQFGGSPGGSGNSIFRRLQVHRSDFSASSYPDALYFAEGVYVSTDDAAANNAYNNASYRRVTFAANEDMILHGGTAMGLPALFAWRDHGLGVNSPDVSVKISHIDVPGEGRFFYGHRARDLPGGDWRYEYAIFNLNSDVSAGGLRIAVPAGVQVSNVGFHAPPYHSDEPYSNDAWVSECSPTMPPVHEVCWRTESFAQNPNANALRWATMYNFWFDANTPPDVSGGVAVLELFKPHTPDVMAFTVVVPSAPASCYANCDKSTQKPILTVDDFTCFINQFAVAQGLPHAQQVIHYANCDKSTTAPVLTVDDFTCFINAFAQGCE